MRPGKVRHPQRALPWRAAVELAQTDFVPAPVRRRAWLCEARLRADALHRVLLAVVDPEVAAIGEVAQARVVRLDVVDLEVGLEKGLPVDVVLVDTNGIDA
jgi:hypothetical protein